jgi:hypothetical protein
MARSAPGSIYSLNGRLTLMIHIVFEASVDYQIMVVIYTIFELFRSTKGNKEKALTILKRILDGTFK